MSRRTNLAMILLGGASLLAAVVFGDRAVHAGIGDIDPASALHPVATRAGRHRVRATGPRSAARARPGRAVRAGPREPVHDDLVVGLVYGLFWGVIVGGGIGLSLLLFTGGGLLTAIATGVAETCTTATVFGTQGCYYLATALLLGGRRLPYRPARFLDWAWPAGLIRVAGLGYQFRHREFQDFLTRHPQ